VAGRAIPGQAGVLSFKGKPGLFGMVKVLRVERPDIGVDALMFLVAGLAIPRDFSMNPFFDGDPFGDRLMTSQAAFGINLFSLGMALLAVRFALKGAVRLGERTRSGGLGLGILAGKSKKGG
jgi:hypothetical protein